MRKYINAAAFFTIICVQGLLYNILGAAGLVRIPSYLPPFSLFSVAAGSFLFGFGAVLAGGCMTMTLVKCGDGRITGWLFLVVFMLSAYLFAAGPLIGVSKYIRTIALVDDALGIRTTAVPIAVYAVLSTVLIIILHRYYRQERAYDEDISETYGIRQIVFEKPWPEEAVPVLTGIILGIAYPVSGEFGRHFGIAITSPIMSYIYMFTNPVETCGGCNPYDETFGWGSMCVLGIIAGSFITAAGRKELKVSLLRRSALIKGVAGSALMGVGAMWGLGCLLGNGLVGTAQLSLKSWYALVFLAAGIWTAVRLTIIPAYGK